MRLLAVDDDPIILDLLPVIFRQAGMTQITTSASAGDALDILSNPDMHFDGLVLDIEMPEMSGIELCRKVRQMPRFRNIPILMLTSVTDRVRIEQAFAAGANDYITKPFDVKEIITRLRVAEKMSKRAQNVPLLDPSDVDCTQREGVHHFEVSDSVRLSDAPNLILPFSLGNYLSQLSRRHLDSCTIFAVRIANIESLFASTRSHEYADALAHTVRAVSKVVDCPKMLMAYEGNGTFLCILQGSEPPSWPEVELDIQAAFDHDAPGFDDGRAMRLILSVGNPITPNASRNQRVKKTFDRAIDRVLNREKANLKQDSPTASGFFGG